MGAKYRHGLPICRWRVDLPDGTRVFVDAKTKREALKKAGGGVKARKSSWREESP